MADPLRPGYFAPTADTPELPLQGIGPNIGGESDTTITLLAEWSRRNSEALVRSATGADLDSTLTVTEGHAHDTRDHSLDWMQSHSWTFACGLNGSGGSREGRNIGNTASAVLGVLLLPVPLDTGDAALYTVLRWRARAKVPAAGFLSCTLYLTLEAQGVGGPSAATINPAPLTIAYDQAEIDQWTEGTPLRGSSAEWLTDATDNIILLVLRGWVSTQAATLFEIQVQWGEAR